MENKKYDVVGIGNALLDLVYNVDDNTLVELGLIKGVIKLVEKEEMHLDSVAVQVAARQQPRYVVSPRSLGTGSSPFLF